MSTSNITITPGTWQLISTGPSTRIGSIQRVSGNGQFMVACSTGVPQDDLIGHIPEGKELFGFALDDGEYLYGRLRTTSSNSLLVVTE
ncbi:hypothetical protein PGN77_11315 [Klebsiella aerogenes]